ncbi:MAG: YggS family pyridoxal phosphate-dependent enzyme, partial [Rhodothermales bacterium]|nr:YggS family pyridoxal phosphate-dependent enzyme [Rhodothermales bacterium]
LSRIGEAAARVGRSAEDVTLVAVGKTFPADEIRRLHGLGHLDFGENKVQELVGKADELADLSDVRWHMIGHLQRNKVKEVVGRVHLFHALDSARLARKLHGRLDMDNEEMDCLVQVNVSGEDSKYGVPPDQLEVLLDGVQRFDRLRLRGLMTLAAPAQDPEDVRHEFASMRELAERVRNRLNIGGKGPILSMGMSNDFEVAIEEGATHVRIGSAIFGPRNYDG